MKDKDDNTSIQNRSLMSIFSYLSQNVDVPKDHKETRLVTVMLNTDGSEFDWGKTAVAFPYRGQWFYQTDNDPESVSTFMLFSRLFRLQAGSAKAAGPTLTLPVR
jgi:hypothetical protein